MKRFLSLAFCMLFVLMLTACAAPQKEEPFTYWTEDAAAITELKAYVEAVTDEKSADYIPVGATLNVDGIRCRIDSVDFAADEVRLTNIEDKNRPIRFSESIQYVRSYVEDAGTAIYDTIPKKPAARESIRNKLKSAQKAQSPHIPKPQKTKGKDMVL